MCNFVDKNLVRCAHNWNYGMLEYWKFFKTALIIPYKRDKILLLRFSISVFHHSIIPGWKKKNVGVAIHYYQAFLEIPIYKLGGMFHET